MPGTLIGICSYIKAAHCCQKSSPSYQFNSLNFDSKKLSVTSVWDHLNDLFLRVIGAKTYLSVLQQFPDGSMKICKYRHKTLSITWIADLASSTGSQGVVGHTHEWLLLIGWSLCNCIMTPNLHKPDQPTWTKVFLSQSTIWIDGCVSNFLGPNGCYFHTIW